MSPIMPPTSLAMQHSPTGTNGSNHSGSQEIGAAAVSPGRRSSEASSIQRPTALGPVEEKQHHLHYLNEFRVEACPLFKQHQCQQHRPFTCFNWHFANQRRRRPIRKPDGSFNYSPDIYCDKYDENTGICPDGDECIYLHRVSGDVERKYHLRYYKTAQCVHATDARGQCVKNGAHCAFAHSSTDLRQPQFDSHETGFSTNVEGEGRDRTSFVVEDPLWHSQDHVLSCYKTEQCRKPARLCRQGYACPFYHNSKDRRRPPAVYKYRSTPCPAAKTVDEWLDPELCEAGDSCQYCHTRTEQQFHPEIYKSTKCNDMLEHGYCPRAVFCAFAHHDSELHVQRTPYVGSSQPSPKEQCSPNGGIGIGLTNGSTTPNYNRSNMQPIAPKSPYASTDLISSSYPKAPGFERGPLSPNSRGMEPLNRLRTHSLNMGHLDMARRQMLTNFGGGDLASGSSLPSHSSLCRSDSGFHAPPLGGLSGQPAMSSITGTLEELSLDLTPIDEQAQNQPRRLSELLGGILSVASPMGVQQGNEGVYPSSPLASYPTESIFSPPTNNRAMISPQQAFGGMAGGFEQQDELNGELDENTKLRIELRKQTEKLTAWHQEAEHYKMKFEQAEMEKNRAYYERDQAISQLETIKLHLAAQVQAQQAQQQMNLANQLVNQMSQEYANELRPSASLSNTPPFNIFSDNTDTAACARCGRDKLRQDNKNGCPLCSNQQQQQQQSGTTAACN